MNAPRQNVDHPPPPRPSPALFDLDDSDNRCFLCKQPSYRVVHVIESYGYPITFQRCGCGIEKQTPMPNQAFFEWFFNSEVFFSSQRSQQDQIWGYYDYFADEPSRLATSKRRYRLLRRWFDEPPVQDVMKIGPATGTMLHVLKEKGHNVLGCDVSTRFAEFARARYDVRIDNGRFEYMSYADGQFDVVLLFNVIENVPNLDELLGSIRRTLRPGGVLILNYVDMHRNLMHALQRSRYFMYRPPVCYLFSSPVMRRMLGKYGFEVEAIKRDVRYLHAEKMATLLRWRWLLSAAKTIGASRISLPIYAYPSRIIVARKRAIAHSGFRPVD